MTRIPDKYRYYVVKKMKFVGENSKLFIALLICEIIDRNHTSHYERRV